ncbi:MAG: NYN domain-containing protein [Thermoplasmata archaeon]
MEDSAAHKALAFLVDGDNASATKLPDMLAEASKYGALIVRRVYGDWTSAQMKSWKEALQEHAITPVQQFPNIAGKNATDSAMIIDAMDILHGQLVDGFCIVSSDSDYTRLATRIREAGLLVIGIGEPFTPSSFRRACHAFISTENLKPAPTQLEKPKASTEEKSKSLDDVEDILILAFENVVKDDGSAVMAELGEALRRLDPAFDPRTYGYPKLVDLIQSIPEIFEVERKKEFGPGAVYVRRKEQ